MRPFDHPLAFPGMRPVPRVMAVHDLSGVGKCSLTVALPILSAMGIEVAALPTAVLSTHTGGLEGYTYRDLTCDMPRILDHWAALGLAFDAIYSGWLGSAQQAEIVCAAIDRFAGPEAMALVDPVMGDHGRLYSTYTEAQVAGMIRLCAKASLITPNLTEASLLLGRPYHAGVMTPAEIESLCAGLSAMGPPRVVITGISTAESLVGAAAWDAGRGALSLHEMPRIPGIWHGTGDIFCSVLLGGLLRGRTLSHAATLAVAFTHDCIARTRALGTDPRFGVDFERGLAGLMRSLEEDASGEE